MFNAQVTDAFLAVVDGQVRDGASPDVQGGVSSTIASPIINLAAPDPTIVPGMLAIEADALGAFTRVSTVISNSAGNVTLNNNAAASHVNTLTFVFLPANFTGGASMGLFTNNPTLSAGMVIGDFTEPTYTGYARTAMTLNPVRKNAAGDYIEDYGSTHFQPTNNVGLPQTMNGYFVMLQISGTLTLCYAEYFDNPVVFTASTSGLDVSFDGMVKNLHTWGGLCGVC